MSIKREVLGTVMLLVQVHCHLVPVFPCRPATPITAVCSVEGVRYDTVFGRIVFTQLTQHSPVRVFSNTMQGLGNYFTKCDQCKLFGVAITNLGNTSLKCTKMGGIFDPDQGAGGTKAGEVGNLRVCADPACHEQYGRLKGRMDMLAGGLSLFQGSPQNIVGLGCVVYDKPVGSDDPKVVGCGQVSVFKYDSALVS